ncbi:phage tail tip fiber protein [Pseudomonas chlororaphis]|uniref:Tip attachment protein J central straight fiber domain-containing protein n=1 Tax=Pseudomonas chlororaphis O6 TaxID=1037915 RepID=A0AB33WSK2_9PSED|nr:DUF1983 domain-containing protein [Pseudomonas chlororaphis]EIM15925.1 hypothetical protein PchlO6_1231 [Pseudomonas chlororaphis O6]
MQSPDFVEGVSGWRLSKDRLELYGMATPVILGRLDAPEPENGSASDQPKPFIVVDGVTYISEAEVERASITNAKIVAGLAEPIRQGGFFSGGYTGDGPENGSGVIAPGTDRLSDMWSVKMEATADGKYVASGLGLGIESQFLVDAGRLAINNSAENAPQPGDALKAGGVTSMLDAMASTISETSLGKDLAAQIHDVLRAELKQGGMLYRG